MSLVSRISEAVVRIGHEFKSVWSELDNTVNRNTLTFNVVDYGADPTGQTDSTDQVQAAINAAGAGEVFFPPGDYAISKIIRPVQGVTLRGYGATLHRQNPTEFTMMKNWPGGDATTTAYNGIGDVTLIGLTFNAHGEILDNDATIVNFAHARNITIRDCSFLNVTGSHAIEVNAIDGALVENTKLLGWKFITGTAETQEALLIDSAIAGSVGGGAADGTPCRNIIVRNCTFGKSDDLPASPVGIGSHGLGPLYETKNITIDGCLFLEQNIAAVRTWNWEDSVITNCKALSQVAGSPYYIRQSNGVMLNNSISYGNFFGRGANVDTSINITVSDCIFYRTNEGIGIQDSQHILVSSCQTSQSRSYSLICNRSSRVTVIGSTFKSAGYESSAAGFIRVSDSTADSTNISFIGNRSVGNVPNAGISNAARAGEVYAIGNSFPGVSVVSSGAAINSNPNRN